MDEIASDQKFIPYGILHYFHAGLTRDETLANLLKSHEKCPQMFPRIDFRDVDFWYKSFEEKNYDLDQQPEYAPLSKLENLPVLDNVIHHLNVEDQRSMQKVCTTFKDFIDTENRIFEKVEFRIIENCAMLETKCGITGETKRTIFRMQGEGCVIVRNNIRTPSEKSVVRAALDEFKKTIEVMHTKVKLLHIDADRMLDYEENRREFIMGSAEILNGLKEKLHVQSLDLHISLMDEFDAFLTGVKLGSLTSLKMFGPGSSQADFTGMSSFFSHLPHLVRLKMYCRTTGLRMNDLVHIAKLKIRLEPHTPQEVLAHRDRVLQNNAIQSQKLCIRGGILYISFEAWRNFLQPYTPIYPDFDEVDDSRWISGSFPIPGDTENHLVFKVISAGEIEIQFEKKKIQ